MNQNGRSRSSGIIGHDAPEYPPRVLIVDDHPLVRDGIRNSLQDVSGCNVVGEAGDWPGALALVRSVPADLLVLDLSMPGRSGVELISQVKLDAPTLRILVITAHTEQQYAVRSFKAGASGYITKGCMGTELLAAAIKVAACGVYVSRSMADALATILTEPTQPLPHHRLSDREHDVFRRLSEGQTLTQIAEALSVSAKTVSTYKARILEKLQMPHDIALIRHALRHELFDHNERHSPPGLHAYGPTRRWCSNFFPSSCVRIFIRTE